MIMPKDFYPTPPGIAYKMASNVDRENRMLECLEPSAGRGDLIEGLNKHHRFGDRYVKINWSVIEADPDFQSVLMVKKYRLIDTDFLSFSGRDKFDLIIANPPFSDGAAHLLRAIEIMYRGQIIFLLNAETLRNPFSARRKLLAQQLETYGAEVEYVDGAFLDAERKTAVDVAIVSIKMDRSIDDSIFNGMTDGKDADAGFQESYDISTGASVDELVAEYNETIDAGANLIISHAKTRHKLSKFLVLRSGEGTKNRSPHYDTTGWKDAVETVQTHVNNFIRDVREHFWRRSLDLDVIKKRLTTDRLNQFEQQIDACSSLDFTQSNIRQFILNIIDGYAANIQDAVLDIFNKFTIRHCFDDGLRTKNIHYFNGWKTNNAYKVKKKVIIPLRGSYCASGFRDFGRWSLNYQAAQELNDIDTVMNYFDGMRADYLSLTDAFNRAFEQGGDGNLNAESGSGYKVESTYFTAVGYKKGTIHLTFKDMDILRRFNIEACKGKQWLPQDYGSKPYKELGYDEQAVVKAFEADVKTYEKNVGRNRISYDVRRLLGDGQV